MSRRVTLSLLFVLVASVARADTPQPLPVKTVEFKADSVGRKMKYNLILPAELRRVRPPLSRALHAARTDEQLHAVGEDERASLARRVQADRRHARRRQLVVRQLVQERRRPEEPLGRLHHQGPDRARRRDLPHGRRSRGPRDQRPVDGRLRRDDARAASSRYVLFDRQPLRRSGLRAPRDGIVPCRQTARVPVPSVERRTQQADQHRRLQHSQRADAQGRDVRHRGGVRRARSLQAGAESAARPIAAHLPGLRPGRPADHGQPGLCAS